jgi:hypothetical protein
MLLRALFSVFSASVCANFIIFSFMELSKNDANLLTIEGVFIFISKKLVKLILKSEMKSG